MGFDTYLEIDDRILLMWRKHASSTPRVLFRFDDLRIDDREDDDQAVRVAFRTSVSAALNNLEHAGLGWGAAVSAYAETRIVGGASSGFEVSQLSGSLSGRNFERAMEAFEALPADYDLSNLGRLMVDEWLDESSEEVSLLTEMTYDGDLRPSVSAAFAVFRRAIERKIERPSAAARAAESLAYLHRTAPMLAWPLIVCVFLHHLPGDLTVELDLTEDADRTADVEDAASALAYAEDYWERSIEASAMEARSLERLFAVLAESGAGAGAEFWFARAADLLGRIDSLRSTPEVTTRAHGDALEALVDALAHTEAPELEVLEKNLRTEESEIDLVLRNGLRDPFWLAVGSPLILVECKNWSNTVGVPELRVFETKMSDYAALCRIGIFVSLSGFTSTFLTRLRTIQRDGGVIFAIDGRDISALIERKQRITDWLKDEGLRRALGPAR